MNVLSKGFSLLEVLVASFILFMVVSVSSSVFYGSVKSKLNAEGYTLSATYAPMLAEHVGLQINKGTPSGSGHWLGVDFSWSATATSSASIKAYAAVDEGRTTNTSIGSNATLWNVTLRVTDTGSARSYQFQHTSLGR